MSKEELPLVSIICLCYNHQDFVGEAIASVLSQDYENIELIVVDDASEDRSGEVIRKVCRDKKIKVIINPENLGNCRAFNNGFIECSGEYIIDFAADDILLPGRVRTGVTDLLYRAEEYVVHYSNAMFINEKGKELGLHTENTKTIDPKEKMPEGDVFAEVLGRYFICPPTVMARRQVFEVLGGYDESLSFEDFDFLVRASREFKFCYSPEVLVKRRILESSKSQMQYQKGSDDLWSILKVCQKAVDLVKNKRERDALNRRLQFECRQVIIHQEAKIIHEYLKLMEQNGVSKITRVLYRIMADFYPKVFR